MILQFRIFLFYATTIFVAFLLFVVFQNDIDNFINRTEFDAEQWKNWEETDSTMTLRWDMTNSLTKKYDLVGMSVSDITALLGKPSGRRPGQLSYYLGMARCGIDTGSLFLEIDNEIVVSYRIWHG
ncbi:MAG: hypothetical protein AAF741_13675 [Bacteroidota bacterium]